ncbi:MAG: hypothetical protein M1818_001031 [Claussenomyces sp. TS43310]|nr:MAG: hypothetical protein M1818_001031 [Claussenomyces sp. TS43310]
MLNILSDDHELVIRQGPAHGKVFVGKEKDRKPVDPPPIIELRIRGADRRNPDQSFLQSPYYFVSCSLLDDGTNPSQSQRVDAKNALAGTLVSSLHRLKDTDLADGAFFIFGDLSVKVEGTFRLQFTLYEARGEFVECIRAITSDPFQVHAAKNFPGMSESTSLTRLFSDQGVRLRLRKDPRMRLGAQGPASDNYRPRQYNTERRRQSQRTSNQLEHPEQASFHQVSHPLVPPYRQPQDYSSASQYSPQVPFAQHPEGMPQLASQPLGDLESTRKHSSLSSSYGGSGQGDEPFFKRSRTGPGPGQQQGYHQQYSFPAPQGSQYSERQDPGSAATQGFAAYTQHHPQPVQTMGAGSGFSHASLPSSGREPGGSAHISRSGAHFFAPRSYQESQSARGMASPYQPMAAPPQSYFPGPALQSQPQYPTYEGQSSRNAFNMLGLPANSEYEIVSLPPRPAAILPSDMPPPLNSRSFSTVSSPHGETQQPSSPQSGEELRQSGIWPPEYRPRDDFR